MAFDPINYEGQDRLAHIEKYVGQNTAAIAVLNGGVMPDIVITQSGVNAVATSMNPLVAISGTTNGDPATVFQNAINALKGVGGLIQFRGSHIFTSGITIYPAIALVGQAPISQGTQGTSLITATTAVTGPIITAAVDPGNSAWVSFPYLANFAIEGTHGQAGQDGVYVTDANGAILDIYMDHVLIFDVGGNGFNNNSAGIKSWIANCYFERCQQNGVRGQKGDLHVTQCYIQNNVLFGIDATSSGSLIANDNNIWSNAGGGVILWSMTSGAIVHDNNFNNNGDNTHPVIVLKSLTSVAKRVLVHDNLMLDTRASLSACQYFVICTLGVYAGVHDNVMSGQKSGNPAISLTANANDNVKIHDCFGYNDTLGQITNPLDTTNNRLGLGGSTTTPVASTDYTISHVAQYFVSAGGTGVSITLKDPAGNTVRSGMTAMNEQVPLGYKINFGAFSVAPTVTTFAT